MHADWLNEEHLECGRALCLQGFDLCGSHTLFAGQREREIKRDIDKERER